ncbi:MAG TPA: acyl carrier protein [Caulobacteraceae bacterium]|nr:acyl carrier protein [Caulobacteraceae bacterium]
MLADDTLSRVREIMLDTFDLDDLEVDRETTAKAVDEWDSLSHIRLMVAVERAFRVKFSNAEVEALRNVGDLVDAIDRKVAAR